MKKATWFKVYDDTTNKVEKLFKSRIEACEYMDKVDPKCERLRCRLYK